MKPLEGIRIVELGTHIAVPMAARLLADWGAEVVKVESPTGDLWRMYGENIACPTTEEENPIFCIPNSNKKLISVNMKSPEGMEVIHKLLEKTDVLVSNIRLKALRNLGLDYESLKERYPRLVYLHFTGYGYDGPLAAAPGFDAAAFWAMGSMMTEWAAEGAPPITPSSAFGDAVVASSVLSGVLGGLLSRERTGKGVFLTTSLYANALWYDFSDLIACQPQYGMRRPSVYGRTYNPFLNAYRCKDGRWVYIAALEFDRLYAPCLEVLGMDEYIEKYRACTTREEKLELRGSLFPMCRDIFLTRSADEWVAAFAARDIVIQKIAKAAELSQSEQGWANGYLQKVEFPNGRTTVMPNTPIHFPGMETGKTCAVGAVGSDTRSVLADLGYTGEQIEHMVADGAVKAAE